MSFFSGQKEFEKGEEHMRAFKVSPDTLVLRTYTSCCNTTIIHAGGNKNPLNHLRPLNALCVYKADGSPHGVALQPRTFGLNANKDHWAAKPNDGVPACDGYIIAPLSIFVGKFFPVMFLSWLMPGTGTNKGSTKPGFYNDGSTVTEIVPRESFVDARHQKP
eukprot:CAMPEP_0196596708 /NCGR_PEP_ID=MMETSP1081-20130531/87504_1 /TAXON_ID=36882 /ORGANISM="Pyramimonas amylifera, Strain CCMP720" /LENGTH=161 /DNA_ID=CAMNT_0041921835 /DNA_START=45 /DNA_END=527 /DNA_ORIENTATION=-